MIKTLSDAWPMFLSFIGIVAWFARLESKLDHLKDDYTYHKEKTGDKEAEIWTKLDNMQATMTSILQSLAKIEGKMESNHDK